ncbi:hypothetical protein [Actinomadura chokoriensis]|uniref:hypothetical protein n=1 Tax=Actinomadura chokoriensis TaxID=454156 RepID=UPI0031F7FA1E
MPLTGVLGFSLWLVSKATRLEEQMNAMSCIHGPINWTTSHPPHDRLIGEAGGSPAGSGHPPGSPLQPHMTGRLEAPWLDNRRFAQSDLARGDSLDADFNGRDGRLNRSAFAKAPTVNDVRILTPCRRLKVDPLVVLFVVGCY